MDFLLDERYEGLEASTELYAAPTTQYVWDPLKVPQPRPLETGYAFTLLVANAANSHLLNFKDVQTALIPWTQMITSFKLPKNAFTTASFNVDEANEKLSTEVTVKWSKSLANLPFGDEKTWNKPLNDMVNLLLQLEIYPDVGARWRTKIHEEMEQLWKGLCDANPGWNDEHRSELVNACIARLEAVQTRKTIYTELYDLLPEEQRKAILDIERKLTILPKVDFAPVRSPSGYGVNVRPGVVSCSDLCVLVEHEGQTKFCVVQPWDSLSSEPYKLIGGKRDFSFVVHDDHSIRVQFKDARDTAISEFLEESGAEHNRAGLKALRDELESSIHQHGAAMPVHDTRTTQCAGYTTTLFFARVEQKSNIDFLLSLKGAEQETRFYVKPREEITFSGGSHGQFEWILDAKAKRYHAIWLCAKHEEFEAATHHLVSKRRLDITLEGIDLLSEGLVHGTSVIVGQLSGIGPEYAAKAIKSIRQRFPIAQHLVSLGTCGSLTTATNVKLRDVVICAPSRGVGTISRQTDDGKIVQISGSTTRGSCWQTQFHNKPDIHLGSFISVSKVIKTTVKRERLQPDKSKPTFVDMETATFYAEDPEVIVVRGISDYCDETKDDSHVEAAAGKASKVAADITKHLNDQ